MKRLIDCFMELITYAMYTVANIKTTQPDFETVRNNIDLLLEKSMKCKEVEHFSDEQYNYARLSVCVWIDEAVLNSDWAHKALWQKQTLQRRYFNITDGGQEFFERLDQLGHDDRDIREVAYYCLALGLSGRYIEKGDVVVLDHLKTKNLKRLFGSSAGEPTLENRQMFPEAYQKSNHMPPPKNKSFSMKGLPVVIGLIPVALFFVLLAVYQYLLKLDMGKFIAPT
jgi:type VI secretion system protein ImpK